MKKRRVKRWGRGKSGPVKIIYRKEKEPRKEIYELSAQQRQHLRSILEG